jgi:geranylgeranyl reductase family protein
MSNGNAFNVIIVGAGPAGASTAIALRDSGLSVGLLDKASFPRDKICGDALSVDVVNQLAILSPQLSSEFINLYRKLPSYGVKIFSPDGTAVDIPFIHKNQSACGYTCERFDFDDLLVDEVKSCSNVCLVENCTVSTVTSTNDNICVTTNHGTFFADVIIGCDGANSVVARSLLRTQPDKDHHSAGLRIYYEGIKSFHPQNFIELHFFQDILPGYLWIFPLHGGRANVGIGMLSSAIARRRINLKETLTRIISSDERFKERFQVARPLEIVKGFGLPLGSKKRTLSGDRFLLCGDAAALIDPFSGEGIANAIRSGRIAAAHIVNCYRENNFSKKFNQLYDDEIYNRMWRELKLSRGLQNLSRFSKLFNFVVRKASTNPHIHQFLIDSLANPGKKRAFLQPSFYYKMLFD